MGLKPQAQKGQHKLVDNQFLNPSLPRLYSKKKKKKKGTHTHYKLYIQLSQISFFICVYFQHN